MPRRPERYQLAFDFGRRSEPTASYRSILENLTTQNPDPSRFVRAVQEEVIVRSPVEAASHLLQHVFVPFDQLDQEELWLLLMNTKNQIKYEVLLYRGTLDMIQVRPAEVFKEAIRVNAASVLLSHNHPSGEPTPSPNDVFLTETLLQVAQMLEITLLDHIVIGRNVWFSMKEKGLAFAKGWSSGQPK